MIHLKELSTKTNGFDLSRIGLGTMRLAADQQAGVDTIHAALDAGVNFLNTADFYGHGISEMIIKEALKSRRREDVFISVKFGGLISPNGKFYGTSTFTSPPVSTLISRLKIRSVRLPIWLRPDM